MKNYNPSRKELSRWAAWFFGFNALFLFLIGISYVPILHSFYDAPFLNTAGKVAGIGFASTALLGHAALLSFVVGLLALLLISISPKRIFAISLCILLSSLLVLSLSLDAILYHLYHYHLLSLVLEILISGNLNQVIGLSTREWEIFTVLVLVVVSVESVLAYVVWRRQRLKRSGRRGIYSAALLAAAWLLSFGLYFSAGFVIARPNQFSLENKVAAHLIMKEAHVLPYLGKRLVSRRMANAQQGNLPLQYPLHPLHVKLPKKQMNILIVAIDAWRYDMMNAQVTPKIAKFAERSLNFKDHFSGGNATQPGIFSLFYSLPPTYWSAMLHQHRGPIFIKELLKEHYQFEVLGSAEFNFPPLNKTVFLSVPNLQVNMPGETPMIRDANMTKEFIRFLKARNDKKHFFGFLFYDAVHGYCQFPGLPACDRATLTNHSAPSPYLTHYKKALHYDDALIGAVLHTLKAQGLLKNTIVILTADHGEEFNDEHLDYWGHASAFDPYQVRTPLVIHWPGKTPETIYYQTSHYDIVPTLMKNVLGVVSQMSSYSVGQSLFSSHKPTYLVVGSYTNYAILQTYRTTIVYPDGNYSITYPDGEPLKSAHLEPILMKQVDRQLNKFFKR